jgi:hypothetical protein
MISSRGLTFKRSTVQQTPQHIRSFSGSWELPHEFTQKPMYRKPQHGGRNSHRRIQRSHRVNERTAVLPNNF